MPAPSPRRSAAGSPAHADPDPRVLDARPDTLDFRDQMYLPTLVEVPTHIPVQDWLQWQVPVLDQGREGACTGYGLATVANYLLLRRRVLPDKVPVSPRMLYDLARRYDEWPGEKYSGSSARGAMKGWHKHGVCSEAVYPSSGRRRRSGSGGGLTDERTSEARRRPLGAYFRVNHRDLVAVHSAIAEVGVLYATAVVHDGWEHIGADGAIPFDDPAETGGHAFALVAYDEQGLWLQNSWGPDWGLGGLARISYDDWLKNGTDLWVARLGAPVTLHTAGATASAHAAGAGRSAAYAYADLRPHVVSIGNEGELRAGGSYGTTPESLRDIFDDDIPRVTAGWSRRRVLVYAHGGLVGESAAVQRLADYRPALLAGQAYPLALIWRTDLWTTVTNLLQDAIRRRRPEGVLDAAKDFLLDRLDDALEPLARSLGGKLAWDEMKENAALAGGPRGALRALAEHLQALAGQPGGVEVHLVGHSAGAILLAPLLTQLTARGLPVRSCTLWAPACTHALFDSHYRPAVESGAVERLALYVLRDGAEQDDHCARIYNKSLLYLVSNALEARPRIPGWRRDRPVRDGVPLLGMERFLTPELRTLLSRKPHRLVVAPTAADGGPGASQARTHGGFDDDDATVRSTFAAILETPAAGARSAEADLQFMRSGSSLRDRRQRIEAGARGAGR